MTLAAWAAIGFDGFSTYPDLLHRLSGLQSHRSYSFVGMASTAGLDPVVGSALALLVGGSPSRRLRRLRASRRRTASVHLCRGGDARAEPRRLAALPRGVARARRPSCGRGSRRSGSCRCCSGSARSRGTRRASQTFVPAIVAAILVGSAPRAGVAARPRAPGGAAVTPERHRGSARRARAGSRASASRHLASIAFCGVLPAVVLVGVFVTAIADGSRCDRLPAVLPRSPGHPRRREPVPGAGRAAHGVGAARGSIHPCRRLLAMPLTAALLDAAVSRRHGVSRSGRLSRSRTFSASATGAATA